MQASERFALSLPCPFPVYLPRPPEISVDKSVPLKNQMNAFIYRSELSHGSPAEHSGESKNELPHSCEIREFSHGFPSHGPLASTSSMPALFAQGMPSSELQSHSNGSRGSKIEGEGGMDDEGRKEREPKKRSKNWTRAETTKLIRVRRDIDAKFRMGRKSELWDEVAEVLQRNNFVRDAQQCKDKWDKLLAGYKEVRDGIREKEDYSYYDELHLLLSGRWKKRGRDTEDEDVDVNEKQVISQIDELEMDLRGDVGLTVEGPAAFVAANMDACDIVEADSVVEELIALKKRKRGLRCTSAVTDTSAVQELLETLLSRQQKFFSDLLDAVEKKKQLKEQLRQEQEDKWRAEEREQTSVFNNAMIILTQTLLSEDSEVIPLVATSNENLLEECGGPKKRSKNWKRLEVLQLIELRGEMDGRFTMLTRRAGLWEELAKALGAHGIRREGKQCREKWEKLMAEFKDVTDGRRDQSESPFFAELKAFMDRHRATR